jgi:hypothetical protein
MRGRRAVMIIAKFQNEILQKSSVNSNTSFGFNQVVVVLIIVS